MKARSSIPKIAALRTNAVTNDAVDAEVACPCEGLDLKPPLLASGDNVELGEWTYMLGGTKEEGGGGSLRKGT